MRSALPLGHKLIALLLAVAVAAGLFVELRRRATESANSAALSFDPVAAQQINAGILHAADPAVVLSQSILTDAAVAKLLTAGGIASSATPITIGEFRARLDLTQPSPGILWVRYRDANLARATTATNIVAETLASWTPSGTLSGTTTAPPAAAPPPAARHRLRTPARTKQPAVHAPAAQNPAAANPPVAANGLAAALAGLQDQLSAAQRRVGGPDTGYSPADGEHQRYLEGQFRAVAQKLNELRAQYAASDPGDMRHLAAIRDALVSGWAGAGSSAGLTDFHTAGTSAAQLGREKSQLADLIGVVEEQRRAVQREEDARSGPIVETPAPTTQAAQPRPVQPPAADTTAQNPALQSGPASNPESNPASNPTSNPAPSVVHPFSGEDNPLRLVRLAGPAGTILWWPAVVAGCLCGLIYLAAVAGRYRSAEEPADYVQEDTVQPGYRMITSTEPVANESRHGPIEPAPPAAVASGKRASFRFEPDSPANPPASAEFSASAEEHASANGMSNSVMADQDRADPDRVDTERADMDRPEPVAWEPLNWEPLAPELMESAPIAPHPMESEPVKSEPVEFQTETPIDKAPAGAYEPAIVESGIVASRDADTPAPYHEKFVEITDPWADELKKALSQTRLGSTFDEAAAKERDARSRQPGKENRRPPQSGRLAG